jgi:hypothetical protein
MVKLVVLVPRSIDRDSLTSERHRGVGTAVVSAPACSRIADRFHRKLC